MLSAEGGKIKNIWRQQRPKVQTFRQLRPVTIFIARSRYSSHDHDIHRTITIFITSHHHIHLPSIQLQDRSIINKSSCIKQHQYILDIILSHVLTDTPVIITNVDHVDFRYMLSQKRNDTMRIRVLDHEQLLPSAVGGSVALIPTIFQR